MATENTELLNTLITKHGEKKGKLIYDHYVLITTKFADKK